MLSLAVEAGGTAGGAEGDGFVDERSTGSLGLGMSGPGCDGGCNCANEAVGIDPTISSVAAVRNSLGMRRSFRAPGLQTYVKRLGSLNARQRKRAAAQSVTTLQVF